MFDGSCTDYIQNAVHAASEVANYQRQVDVLFPPNDRPRSTSACFQDSTCAVIKPHAIVDGLSSTGWSKKLTPFVLYSFLYVLISSNIDRFSNLFHNPNQENICNNTVAKAPTTPQVCRYTTLWNVSVLKATTENKTSHVTTQFKKSTTGNNVFIVSVII